MPGTNAGTGRPLNFQCSKCRLKNLSRERWGTKRTGFINEVKVLGPRRKAPVGNAGMRNSRFKFQYECRACGHVGWSRHVDLERRWELEHGEELEVR
jgi:hypothetical protein